jgi:ABC-type sugar transport system substrate-binding protein
MPGNITSNERRQGFEEGIAEFPGCEILDTQPVEFNKEKAMTVMENMLTKYPKIDFVFCVNDNSAIGAYEAAAAVGRADEMVIVGHDGMEDCLKYIMDGKIKYSCFQNPYKMGRDTITALVEYWSGNKVTRDQYMFDCEIIDKNNAQSFLDIVDEMAKWYKIK